jgi:two-component system OmpR family sensor kinase
VTEPRPDPLEPVVVRIPGDDPPAEPVRRPWTLRARLLGALLALSLVGLAGFGVASVLLIEHSLVARADQQLGQLGPPKGPPTERNHVPTDFRVIVLDPYGQVLYTLPLGETSGPVLPQFDASTVTERRGPFTVRDSAGGADWRIRVNPLRGGGAYVVALSLDTVSATVRTLVIIELVVGGVVLLLLGVVAYGVVRVGLRPLTRIEHTAEAIAGGELDRRVPDSDPRTEAGRLGRALNTMLSRLSAALRERERSEQRLRRFVADASHELRTPLTSIRGFAELYRRGGAADQSDVDRMMGRIESEAVRMGRLVDDLLMLARLDQERALDLSEVDLTVLAGDAVQDATARDPDRRISLELPDGSVRVTGDEHRLRQVVTNLVTNAVTHTPAGTPVQVVVSGHTGRNGHGPALAHAGAALRPSADVAVLEVRDHGQGIPADQAPHVFDRFYRADVARSRRSGGAGLGLAITAAILEAHNGRVELLATPGGGTTFRVLLPVT